MLIYLLRHGIAIDRTDPDSPIESERFLTEKGIRRTIAAAKGVVALGLKPQRILSSPFVRARQTAEIAANCLGLERSLITDTDALLWDAPPLALYELLASMPDTSEVLCTGHAPHLDHFIAHLIGHPMPVTELKKSALAILETDFEEPGDAHILGIYPPKVLRILGRLA